MGKLKYKSEDHVILIGIHSTDPHYNSCYIKDIMNKEFEILNIDKSNIKGYYSGVMKLIINPIGFTSFIFMAIKIKLADDN